MKQLSTLTIVLASAQLICSCGTHKMTKLSSEKLDSNSYYIVPLDATVKENLIWTDSKGKFRVLSEVSPDAVVTSVTDLTSKVTADLKSGEKFSAEQATKITQSIHEFGKRTIAVNILRDALYRIEEYNINRDTGQMDTATYKLFLAVLDVAKTIAAAEVQAEDAKQSEAKADQQKEITKQLAIDAQADGTTPSDARSRYFIASQWEQKGFNLLLSNNIDGAIEAFQNAENIYPAFHNVYEIGKILKSNKATLSKGEKDSGYKAVLQTILTQYSWGMPDDIKKKLDEKSK